MINSVGGSLNGARSPRILFQPIFDVEMHTVFAHQAIFAPCDAPARETNAASRIAAQHPPLDSCATLLGGDRAMLAVPMSNRASLAEPLLDQLIEATLLAGISIDSVVAQVGADERGSAEDPLRVAEACAARGIGVAISSFAAGPVGMRLLARINPRFVTFDTAVVRNIASSLPRQHVVRSVTRLMRSMAVPLTASGVDDASDLTTLRALGLRYLQGDHLARAVAATRIFGTAVPPARRAPRSAFAIMADRDASAMHRRLAHHLRQPAAEAMRV